MPKHAYRNVSNISLHSFLTFGSIAKHLLHKITDTAARPWSHLDVPIQKGNAFTKPLNHKELGFSFHNLKLHKLSLGSHFWTAYHFETRIKMNIYVGQCKSVSTVVPVSPRQE